MNWRIIYLYPIWLLVGVAEALVYIIMELTKMIHHNIHKAERLLEKEMKRKRRKRTNHPRTDQGKKKTPKAPSIKEKPDSHNLINKAHIAKTRARGSKKESSIEQ